MKRMMARIQITREQELQDRHVEVILDRISQIERLAEVLMERLNSVCMREELQDVFDTSYQ